jgi:hypothetical protein
MPDLVPVDSGEVSLSEEAERLDAQLNKVEEAIRRAEGPLDTAQLGRIADGLDAKLRSVRQTIYINQYDAEMAELKGDLENLQLQLKRNLQLIQMKHDEIASLTRVHNGP